MKLKEILSCDVYSSSESIAHQSVRRYLERHIKLIGCSQSNKAFYWFR